MEINKLKIGQKIWIHNGEFPIQLIIELIDSDNDEVWCDDGWNHSVEDIYSSEYKCKLAN